LQQERATAKAAALSSFWVAFFGVPATIRKKFVAGLVFSSPNTAYTGGVPAAACRLPRERSLMNTAESKHSTVKTFKYLWLGILLCTAVGITCFLCGRLTAAREKAQPQLSAVVLEQQLADIRELATVTYAYTNMAQFESSNDFYGMKIPFTTKSFILTYDGTIKAGINLSAASVEIAGREVTVTLPEPEILSHEIDEPSVEIFDEKTSIFNPFTVEDFTAFQADQKASMEEQALGRGLLQEARDRASDSVFQMLEAILPEDCTLIIL